MDEASGRWMSLIKMSRRWRRCGITQTLIRVFVRGHTTRTAHSSWQPSILLSSRLPCRRPPSLSTALLHDSSPYGRCRIWALFSVTGFSLPPIYQHLTPTAAIFLSSPAFLWFLFLKLGFPSRLQPPIQMLTDAHQLVTVSTIFYCLSEPGRSSRSAPPYGAHQQQ